MSEEKQDQYLNLRMTKSVKYRINENAARRGMSLTDYARNVLINEAYNKDVLDALDRHEEVLERQNVLLESILRLCLDSKFGLGVFMEIANTNEPCKTAKDFDNKVKSKRDRAIVSPVFIDDYLDGIPLKSSNHNES